jgi:hypothetical protein
LQHSSFAGITVLFHGQVEQGCGFQSRPLATIVETKLADRASGRALGGAFLSAESYRDVSPVPVASDSFPLADKPPRIIASAAEESSRRL